MKDNAKVWFNAVKNELQDFADFRDRFRAEFLCEEVQDRAKEIWRTKKYIEGNILNYFYARVGEASRFYPPLSPYKVHKTIVSQYPRDIQYAMAGVDLSNQRSVVQALTHLEDTRYRTSRANSGDNRRSDGYDRRRDEPHNSGWRPKEREPISSQDARNQTQETSSRPQQSSYNAQNGRWRERRDGDRSYRENESEPRYRARGNGRFNSMAPLQAQEVREENDNARENISAGATANQDEFSENINAARS